MKCPVFRIHNWFYHIMNGASVKSLQHFNQLVRGKEFMAYDHGSKKLNELAYAEWWQRVEENEEEKDRKRKSDVPNFLDFYGRVDIPVVICAGDDDGVIPSLDVKRHYIQLVKTNTAHTLHKWKLFPECGHIDLSYSPSEALVRYVEEEIQLNNEKNDDLDTSYNIM